MVCRGAARLQRLTGSQVREGRMILGWEQSDLARYAKVEFSAVFALELYCLVSDRDLNFVCEALKAHGIEVDSGSVVRRPDRCGSSPRYSSERPLRSNRIPLEI